MIVSNPVWILRSKFSRGVQHHGHSILVIYTQHICGMQSTHMEHTCCNMHYNMYNNMHYNIHYNMHYNMHYSRHIAYMQNACNMHAMHM